MFRSLNDGILGDLLMCLMRLTRQSVALLTSFRGGLSGNSNRITA